MPRGGSYGDKLRIARERAGIDVVTLAKRLHIRPDILKAIEGADFERMPARGYTRNMIRAYARQVGLNEKEISEMYLDEVHIHETGTPRLSRSSSDSYTRRREPSSLRLSDSRPQRSRNISDSRNRDPYSRDAYGRDLSRDLPSRNLPSRDLRSRNLPSRDFSRDLRSSEIIPPASRNYSRSTRRQSVSFHDDPSMQPMQSRLQYPNRYPSNRSNDRSIRFASSPSRRFDDTRGYRPDDRDGRYSRNLDSRDLRSGHSTGNRSRSIRFNGAPAGGSSRRRPITLTQSSHSYADLYSGTNSRSRSSELNLPLVLIIAVVAIAVIIAVVVLFNSSTQSVEDIPDIPIAGYSDTSNPEDQIEPVAALAEPTSAQLTYEVESGGKSWIEIYENGNSEAVFSGTVTGPATETYDVAGTLTFAAANPTPVKVTVNGEEVQLTKSPKSGYYTYTLDFTAILEKWRSENDPNYSASANASDPNAASNSGNNAASNSSGNTSANRSANGGSNNTSGATNRSSNT